MIAALLLVPSVAAAAAFFIRSDLLRRRLLLFTGVAHAGMSLETWIHPPSAIMGGASLSRSVLTYPRLSLNAKVEAAAEGANGEWRMANAE